MTELLIPEVVYSDGRGNGLIEKNYLTTPAIPFNSPIETHIEGQADFWAMKYRTLKGKPYRFRGTKPQQKRAFLQKMLADQSQQKTYQKSRQAGVSENSVSELLFLANKYAYKKFMYVFPTLPQMKDFVQTRVEPAIEDSPYIYQHLDKKKNNIKLKHLFNCDLMFRSGSTPRAGEGADIDCVFFDERDRMATSVLEAFKEGLSSSDLGFIRDISTPSLPGYGVNLSFEQSDKKHWFVKCDACGEWQVLTFPESIVKHTSVDGKHKYWCKKCKAVDRINRDSGIWVPEITSVQMPWSGYQVSQLDCPWITAETIVDKKNRMLSQLFFNYVLGKPYVGNNLLILQPHINGCIIQGLTTLNKTGKIVAGVDWGDISWIVIGMVQNEKMMVLYYEKIAFIDPERHHQRVGELIDGYKIDTVICDYGYGRVHNSILMKKYPGKVWACRYNDQHNSQLIENVWNERLHRVTVNRTISLRVMARSWKMKDFILPSGIVASNPLSMEYFNHLKSLAVKLEEIEEGVVWERIGHSGPDHLAHATNYLHIGYYGALGRGYATIGYLDSPSAMDTSGRKIQLLDSNSKSQEGDDLDEG